MYVQEVKRPCQVHQCTCLVKCQVHEYFVDNLQVISKRAKMLAACAVVLSRHEKARMSVLACM